MRRKPGSLVPLEMAICACASDLQREHVVEFHGYEIAKRLADRSGRRLLPAYGTLYRALGRLKKMGLLESHWEPADISLRENRPRRRLYSLTAEGEAAAVEATRSSKNGSARLRRRWAPA